MHVDADWQRMPAQVLLMVGWWLQGRVWPATHLHNKQSCVCAAKGVPQASEDALALLIAPVLEASHSYAQTDCCTESKAK